MLDTLLQWFVNPGFMPHSFCLLKNPAIMTLHVASDGLIALAYFSIPIALANFVRRRKDLVFSETILLFAVFILSCGQYLRQQSGSLCVDSADFGGLENPVIG